VLELWPGCGGSQYPLEGGGGQYPSGRGGGSHVRGCSAVGDPPHDITDGGRV
jgi:hypothetical protein